MDSKTKEIARIVEVYDTIRYKYEALKAGMDGVRERIAKVREMAEANDSFGRYGQASGLREAADIIEGAATDGQAQTSPE